VEGDLAGQGAVVAADEVGAVVEAVEAGAEDFEGSTLRSRMGRFFIREEMERSMLPTFR
jgi:hypothetical protein